MPLLPLHSLPSECFSNVLFFLDRKTLYNCLFVNRYYCRSSISIVWRDPFTVRDYKSLINTLLSCLNEDEISSLIPFAIYFNNNQPPLFEYGKFIRRIAHDFCVDHVINWLKLSNRDNRDRYNDCRILKLVNVIYHMIMRESSNLQEFSFDGRVDLPNCSIFTIYKPGITKLRSLSLNLKLDFLRSYKNIVELLRLASKFCNGITNCKLWFTELDNEFIKPSLNIVKLQPLERLSICFGFHMKENIRKVIYALEFRSKTLKELTFKGLNFQNIDLSFMSKLECLERLEFVHCREFMSENLFGKNFQLKELKIWYGDFTDDAVNNFGLNLNITEAMINSFFSKSLLRLSLNIITPNIAIAIREFCPSIKFLYITIWSGEFLDSIIPPICEISSLKTLKIGVDIFDCEDYAGSLVEKLGDHLKFVEDLNLNFDIELSSFEYFTNNCKADLKMLIIHIPASESSRNYRNYLTCVNNYQKVHNSLKSFGINRCSNEDVSSLKNQGIDVFSASYDLGMLKV